MLCEEGRMNPQLWGQSGLGNDLSHAERQRIKWKSPTVATCNPREGRLVGGELQNGCLLSAVQLQLD